MSAVPSSPTTRTLRDEVADAVHTYLWDADYPDYKVHDDGGDFCLPVADTVLALPAIRQALARSQAIDAAEVCPDYEDVTLPGDDVYHDSMMNAHELLARLRSIEGTP